MDDWTLESVADDSAPLFAQRFGAARLDALFPVDDRAAALSRLVAVGSTALDSTGPRFHRSSGQPQPGLDDASFPEAGVEDITQLVRTIADTYLSGAVNWRHSSLHYNLGAPPTLAGSALYALGLDANVYLINDGLAGRAIEAEVLVSKLLSRLAGVPESDARGVFVFGGTGTIAYGIRCGLAKQNARLITDGVAKEAFVAITEEAHFSHARSSRWLGLGDSQIVILPANPDRTTSFETASAIIDERVAAGGKLAALVLNGGTTYDHMVDDIPRFSDYLTRLAAREKWDYRPHLHVDSVIGWEWLFFRDRSVENDRHLLPATRTNLAEQAVLVTKAIQLADSWGVDFHKGAGCSPIDCSVVQFNNGRDLGFLNGGTGDEMHQLASELSASSPADYTLETSRAGAKALAALGTIYALGADGYRTVLAGLVDAAQTFRDALLPSNDMQVENRYSRGYQSMVRLFPPSLAASPLRWTERVDSTEVQGEFIREVNRYIRDFVDWDERERMSIGGSGPYYSYSSKFVPTPSGVHLSGLKFYPTSPRLSNEEAREAAGYLVELKRQFDAGHSAR